MTPIQKKIILSLKANGCNISDAIKKNKCSLESFYSFFENDDFKNGYEEAKQLADDFARTQFMKLIQKGDKTAIIEYQKMLRQSDTANDYKKIRREVMAVFIKSLETKTAILKEFCNCFGCSKNTAEDFYKRTLIEYSLKTPAQRKKELQENTSGKMSERFSKGELGEVEMYQALMQIALYDAENSEYPSERKGAMDKVIDIQRRLEEINERQRKEAELDDVNLIDGFDSMASGMTPSEIEKMRGELALETVAIENADS